MSICVRLRDRNMHVFLCCTQDQQSNVTDHEVSWTYRHVINGQKAEQFHQFSRTLLKWKHLPAAPKKHWFYQTLVPVHCESHLS